MRYSDRGVAPRLSLLRNPSSNRFKLRRFFMCVQCVTYNMASEASGAES